MKEKIIGAIFVSVAAILWGLDGVTLTPRLYNLNVGFVVFMFHLIPFVIMNLFMFKEYKYLKKFDKSDYTTFFLIAFFGGAVGTLAIVKALFLVNFNHLSVIVMLQKLQPVFAIILAGILLKEKIKKGFIVWAGVAVIASYFLAFGFNLPVFGANTMAVLLALLAAFSYGSATVFGKKVLKKYSFHTSTFFRFGFATVILFFYVLATGAMEFAKMTSLNWIILLIITFVTGAGAIFLYYLGLKKIKASVATICELFFPISAVVFDYLINGNALSLIQWVSAAVMIFAIVHISLDNN